MADGAVLLAEEADLARCAPGRDAQRHEQAPRLTARQLDALELLGVIANDPSFYLQTEFQPGEVQLLNNARVLHAREANADYDDPAERRHLLRLWLTAHAFASVEDTLCGGIPARQGR
jgi:alpha-ketoglutarate-dependent taurine dioxygenase